MSLNIAPNEITASSIQSRRAINDNLEKTLASNKSWYEYPTAHEYRRARFEGLDGFRKPVVDPDAQDLQIKSAHGGHFISLRKLSPEQGKANNGMYLHFHGGGFVINSNKMYDPFLRRLAKSLSMTIVSVEYRKAPEHPFPAPVEDAIDAVLFTLSQSGEKQLGGHLKLIGGESAGAYLAVWAALHLKNRGIDVLKHISAMILTSGMYDLAFSPSARQSTRPLVLNYNELCRFVDAAMPPSQFPLEVRIKWSPLYCKLDHLPPALFLVGTEDPLLDDTVFMATKWAFAGNQTTLKIIPQGCHTFISLPTGEIAEEGFQEIFSFLKSVI